MKTKTCLDCKLEKKIELFPFKQKSKNLRYGRCDICHPIHQGAYYTINSKRKKVLRRSKYRKLVDSFKSSGCVKCGDKRLPVLQFHHVDPNEKEMNIGSNGKEKSLILLKKEIEKCIVVCANCHLMIHFELREKFNGSVV